MSSSASKSKKTKPKRPLSGYNLYYRYKRNRILSATNRRHAQTGGALSPEEEARTISAILTAVPGLEGVPPAHPLWNSPAESLNELRGATIRREMAGKLLPNENARNRLHRKVHGMGFVEMGRVMNETWSASDDYTKQVFAELAAVGRVEYKKLMEDYRLKEEEEAKKRGDAKAERDKAEKARKNKMGPSSPQAKKKAQKQIETRFVRAASLPVPAVATPQAFFKPNALAFVSPAASFQQQQQQQQQLAFQLQASASFHGGTISPQACSSFDGQLHRSIPPAMMMTYERRVSSGSSGHSPSSHSPVQTPLSPSPMETSPCDVSQAGANVDILSLIAGGIIPPPPLGDPRAAAPASLPPPPLFEPQAKNGIRNLERGIGAQDLTIDVEENGDVSTEDFLDFIGKLDHALDMDFEGDDSSEPSLIFGKPVHDVPNHLTPMPGGCELNNPRARTA